MQRCRLVKLHGAMNTSYKLREEANDIETAMGQRKEPTLSPRRGRSSDY